MANGHGGHRPGSGRKKLETKVYQATRRDQLQAVVTDEDWEQIVRKAVEDAKTGDYVARSWLTPYVAGKVPEEIVHKGDTDDPLEIIIRK